MFWILRRMIEIRKGKERRRKKLMEIVGGFWGWKMGCTVGVDGWLVV